jgi:hypothetical protein
VTLAGERDPAGALLVAIGAIHIGARGTALPIHLAAALGRDPTQVNSSTGGAAEKPDLVRISPGHA